MKPNAAQAFVLNAMRKADMRILAFAAAAAIMSAGANAQTSDKLEATDHMAAYCLGMTDMMTYATQTMLPQSCREDAAACQKFLDATGMALSLQRKFDSYLTSRGTPTDPMAQRIWIESGAIDGAKMANTPSAELAERFLNCSMLPHNLP